MATATTPETTTWALDASHSSIGFSVKHLMVTTVKGSFTTFAATIGGEGGRPSAGQISATVDAASLTTANEQRDAHLRSADFFDVATYPEIRFTGKRLEGDVFGDSRLIGDLTIRDVTREITLDVTFEGRAKDPWGGQRIAYSAEGKIKRTDFGLNWNQALETGGVLVSEDVKLSIEAVFVQQ